MNTISAFTNNAFLCLKNLHRFELEEACIASQLTDSKTANVAVVWIGLAGLAFASYRLAKWLVTKKDPKMIEAFASRWKMMHPGQRYVPMNGLFTEQDCAHLKTLFQSWRLHTEFCFFDLLGAQMHRNWKWAGAGMEDLRAFGQICKALSAELTASTLPSYAHFGPPDFKKISKQIETLGNRLPNVNAKELQIFLKALSDPEKTKVLGLSLLDYFEGSEPLRTGKASQHDIDDFLEYAADMHPNFSDLFVADDNKRWQALNALYLDNNTADPAELDRATFLLQIKELFEARIFDTKLSYFRVFMNLTGEKLEELDEVDVVWINRQYTKYLGKNYLNDLAKIFTPLGKEAIETGRSARYPSSLQNSFRQLAAACSKKGALSRHNALKKLETDIIHRIYARRGRIRDEEAYGKLFMQMTRLYQTVQDLRLIADPPKMLQGDSIFPSSLSSLAFLSSAPAKFSGSEALPQHFSDASSRSSQNAVSAPKGGSEEEAGIGEKEEEEDEPETPRVKIKTRPEPPPPIEKIPLPPPLPRTIATPVKRPHFPEKASPEVALQHLLANGFVIERVRGSHYQMKHALTNTPTTVPLHGDRLKPGTLNSIRQAFYQSQGFET